MKCNLAVVPGVARRACAGVRGAHVGAVAAAGAVPLQAQHAAHARGRAPRPPGPAHTHVTLGPHTTGRHTSRRRDVYKRTNQESVFWQFNLVTYTQYRYTIKVMTKKEYQLNNYRFFFYTTLVANRLTAHLMVSGYRSLWTPVTPGVSHARCRPFKNLLTPLLKKE